MGKVEVRKIIFSAILDLVKEVVITKRAKVDREVLIKDEMQTKTAKEMIEPGLEEAKKIVAMVVIVAWVTIDAMVSMMIGGNILGTVEVALTTMMSER